MLQKQLTTLRCWWQHQFGKEEKPPPPSTLPLQRPDLAQLAAMHEDDLPSLVRQSPAALRYLRLLGDLDWTHFPERAENRAWPGPKPAPRAPFAAAFLVKLEEEKTYMSGLRTFLVENPALVWLLGFPLVPAPDSVWGFDVEASVPSRKQLGRVLRTLKTEQCRFLLRSTIALIRGELPDDLTLGEEISLDTKHIIAWVRENNPKERMSDRFVKTKQPKGDTDCKLGFKPMSNQRTAKAPEQPTHTPTTEGIPAGRTKSKKEGQYFWGYASGLVAAKVHGWCEVALADLTLTFDHDDRAYFFPLMAQTEENLGRKPKSGALDAGFDAFYIHEYFHEAGGFAAVPWADRADHHKTFDDQGLPLCKAGLPMPLKSTFFKRSNCLVPHECGRYVCPLRLEEKLAEAEDADGGETVACPIDHPNRQKKDGCITTLPTSVGARLRHELDRESDEYKRLYNQRSATERINALAVDLGIERPKLRNHRAIANQATLIYVLINLRALNRVRAIKEESMTNA